jgi:hypothetical protein
MERVVLIEDRVYIISKEPLKVNDWYFSSSRNDISRYASFSNTLNCYKVEMTNDKVLINSGVNQIKKTH